MIYKDDRHKIMTCVIKYAILTCKIKPYYHEINKIKTLFEKRIMIPSASNTAVPLAG